MSIRGEIAALRTIIDVQHAMITEKLSVHDVLSRIVAAACEITNGTGALVSLLHDDALDHGQSAGILEGPDDLRLPRHGSLAGLAVDHREVLLSPDVEDDDRAFAPHVRNAGVRSLVVVPLFGGDEVAGVLSVVSRQIDAFGEADVAAVTRLGAFVASVLEAAVTLEDRRREHDAYRLIAESSGDVVVQIQPSGEIEWASSAVREVYGYGPAEMVGMQIRDLVRPEHLPRYLQLIDDARDKGDQVAEIAAVRADGTTAWTEVAARVVRNEDGAISHWVARVRDVSAAHADREAVERSEALFRATMDNAPIGQALVGSDGRFLRVNPALATLLGRCEEVLLASTWQELTHPDDLDEDSQFVQDLLDGRRDSYRLVKRYLRPDGQIVWGDLSVAAVRDPHGRVRHFVSQILDVTESRRREDVVRQTAERFQQLAEHSADVLAQYDDAARVTWVSPNCLGLLGYPPEDLLGTTSAQIVAPSHRQKVVAEMMRLSRTDEEGHLELPLIRPDGSTVWVDLASTPLHDEAGQRIGRIARMRDITAQVAEREDLHRRATRDPLTGLLSRDEGYRRLTAVLGHPARNGSRSMLAFLDVDALKVVNDSHGHQAGDELLQVVSARIRERLRADDCVARVGGDEIIIVLSGLRDPKQGLMVLEDMLAYAHRPLDFEGIAITPSLSVGVTLLEPGEDADEAIARADRAMYQAKRAGGNMLRLEVA